MAAASGEAVPVEMVDGLIAANASGPRRHLYGTVRDLPAEPFDPKKRAEPFLAWHDPADGQDYVVDGHHGLAWAERDGATHPTVKPLALMRWCVRLVTPPGGVVLDCFAGSGTTLIAARDEGFRSVGIEREAEYMDMILERYRRRFDPAAAEWADGREDDPQLNLLGGVG